MSTKVVLSVASRGILLACTFAITAAAWSVTEGLKIPNLGESSTSLFSADYEHQLGRMWLRSFSGQAPIKNDPLLHSYLESLVFELIQHSELQDRRVELVIVDNPTINAFAVPGGVIGVHSGLFQHAVTEDEFATVIAHEIAHLSQRHFSRRMEMAQEQGPMQLAGLLAGVLLAATVCSDAGMAAMTTAQGLAQDAQLRYSRSNEAEEDRVGLRTLYNAGMDPYAAPQMFERMYAATRYSQSGRIPEFLRTHPLSEKRISDTRARAMQYPKRIRSMSIDYQLMRARVAVQAARTPDEAVATFRSALEGNPISTAATTYGLVIALTAAGRADEASLALDSILSSDNNRIEYVIADAEIDIARGNTARAVETLERRLELSPGNHPLTMSYAHALQHAGSPHLAEAVLVDQSRRMPNDLGLWYLLAEVQGLAGNIVGLHRSRAEYFILTNALDAAERHLTYAQDGVGSDFTTSSLINQRMRDIQNMRAEMDRG
ncbi:MAG: peptidase M48 [Halieaceae bacterium]|nr:peptidase M48 [Halieaceae bacterium]